VQFIDFAWASCLNSELGLNFKPGEVQIRSVTLRLTYSAWSDINDLIVSKEFSGIHETIFGSREHRNYDTSAQR
jgi:hypothetical protein